MGSYNFRSSGTTEEQRIIERLTSTTTAIGIKTPLQLGYGEQQEIVAMHFSLADQVHDNLKNLLLTNWGERVGLYDFGANLRPILSEFATQDDFDANATERISAAVGRWMPYVSLEDFISSVEHTENKSTAVVRVTITYSIPTLSVKSKALEIILYAM